MILIHFKIVSTCWEVIRIQVQEQDRGVLLHALGRVPIRGGAGDPRPRGRDHDEVPLLRQVEPLFDEGLFSFKFRLRFDRLAQVFRDLSVQILLQ